MKFQKIIDEFFRSHAFMLLRPRTQHNYLYDSKDISKLFGRKSKDKLRAHHIRDGMDSIAHKGLVAANRKLSCTQKICSWAYERNKLPINPCVGVRKFKEKPRDRYINDDEYGRIFNEANKTCQIVMEISYLCIARVSDVLDIKLSDIRDEGIYIEQNKTGKKQIKMWSPRLLYVVMSALCINHKREYRKEYLLINKKGNRCKLRTIQNYYLKAKRAAGLDDCTLQDIKAKGVSDFEGTLAEKQHASGHKTITETAKYNRKPDLVGTVK